MDLAKIRQKAQRQREELPPSGATAPVEPVEPPAATDTAESAEPAEPADEPVQAEDCRTAPLERCTPAVNESPVPQPVPGIDLEDYLSTHVLPALLEAQQKQFPPKRRGIIDPLQVLLAGREAAGCEEDLPLASDSKEEQVNDAFDQFLCFMVSDELYGINIMEIKEIIKPREVTEVPRVPSFVSGIISLRGVIIPIIDMLNRLGLSRDGMTGRERIVVVRHGETFSGLFVDEVIQVVRIAKERLEPPPAVLEGIDREFVSGIGRTEDRMIILLDMEHIADINLY